MMARWTVASEPSAQAGGPVPTQSGCGDVPYGLNLVRIRSYGGGVKLSQQVKPISYLKARAPEVLRGLARRREPVVITLNGEAKAVLQDIATYEETQETLALLKILALTNKSVLAGNVSPVREAFARIRDREKR